MDVADSPEIGEPPADPEDWTHEQWIAWLKATDEAVAADENVPPVTAVGRMTHSAGGQMLGSAMLGLAAAMYGRQDDDIVIVAEGPSGQQDDEPFSVHLDPDHPERSSVVFRSLEDPSSPSTSSTPPVPAAAAPAAPEAVADPEAS